MEACSLSTNSPHPEYLHAGSTAPASTADNINIGRCKKITNTPRYPLFSFTGNEVSAATRHQLVNVKGERFEYLYGKQDVDCIKQLCKNWRTTDFESVLAVHMILKTEFKLTPAQITNISADQIILHCLYKQRDYHPNETTISNQRGYSAIFIRDYHHTTYSVDELNNYQLKGNLLDASELASGGIHFLLSMQGNPTANNFPAANCIEIECNLAHVLARGGQIFKDVLSWQYNTVFVVLAPGAQLPFTLLKRPAPPDESVVSLSQPPMTSPPAGE